MCVRDEASRVYKPFRGCPALYSLTTDTTHPRIVFHAQLLHADIKDGDYVDYIRISNSIDEHIGVEKQHREKIQVQTDSEHIQNFKIVYPPRMYNNFVMIFPTQ